MKCHNLQLMMVAAVLCSVSACTGTEAELAGAEIAEDVEVEPTRIALRKSASAAADEIDGYCENGVGVYLSAAEDTAELTLYVVTPAESATFERPALHFTVQQGDREMTEDTEFETVTLNAGESRTFFAQAQGKLMDVAAAVTADQSAAL